MRIYELVLVIKPSLSEADRKKLVESVKGIVKGMTITQEKDWGSRALAYPINREQMGHYYDFLMESEEGLASDVEKKLLDNENILRHLVIRKK